jgi:hypothetical protein
MSSGYKINCKIIRLVDGDFPVEYIFPSPYLILVYRFTGHQPTPGVIERKCLADHRRKGFSRLWTLIELPQLTGPGNGILCSYLCLRLQPLALRMPTHLIACLTFK